MNSLDGLRLLLFFLTFPCEVASDFPLDDLGRDTDSPPIKLDSPDDAADPASSSPSSSGPVDAETRDGLRRGPFDCGGWRREGGEVEGGDAIAGRVRG